MYIDDNDQTWTYTSSEDMWTKYTTTGNHLFTLLPTGSEERGVLGVGSIPVEFQLNTPLLS